MSSETSTTEARRDAEGTDARTPPKEKLHLGGEWPVTRFLMSLCWSRFRVLALSVLLAAIAFLLEGIGIGMLIPLAEALMSRDAGTSAEGPLATAMVAIGQWLPGDNRLVWLSLAVFLLILAKTVTIYAYHCVTGWLNGHVTTELRETLFRKALGIGLLSAERLGIGRLHNTIDTQVWHISDGLETLSRLIAAVAASMIFTALLLTISWQLTAFVVVAFGAVSLLMRVVRLAVERLSRIIVDANADVSTRLVESLSHHRLIRAFGSEQAEISRFAAAAQRLRQAFLKSHIARGIVEPGTELLYVPVMLATIALGLSLDYGLPTLMAFLLLLYRMVPHVRCIDHTRVELAALNGPVGDIETVLTMPDDGPKSGTARISGIDREIRLDNVGFRYPGAESGLEGVSFSIAKGQVVALVGHSGSGKSTIVNLLFRFFDPHAGRILADDRPLPDLDIADWRACLAIAGQDIELMDGTIRDNIVFGCPNASMEDVAEAARKAHADDFITRLPDGYETRVGARGLTFSGGQRQRISLARALVRRPDLLILDEATNALDGLSEEIVLERLKDLRGQTSVLVIAHRMSTIRAADHVVVLDHGRIVEAGSPRELTQAMGRFQSLSALENTLPDQEAGLQPLNQR